MTDITCTRIFQDVTSVPEGQSITTIDYKGPKVTIQRKSLAKAKDGTPFVTLVLNGSDVNGGRNWSLGYTDPTKGVCQVDLNVGLSAQGVNVGAWGWDIPGIWTWYDGRKRALFSVGRFRRDSAGAIVRDKTADNRVVVDPVVTVDGDLEVAGALSLAGQSIGAVIAAQVAAQLPALVQAEVARQVAALPAPQIDQTELATQVTALVAQTLQAAGVGLIPPEA